MDWARVSRSGQAIGVGGLVRCSSLSFFFTSGTYLCRGVCAVKSASETLGKQIGPRTQWGTKKYEFVSRPLWSATMPSWGFMRPRANGPTRWGATNRGCLSAPAGSALIGLSWGKASWPRHYLNAVRPLCGVFFNTTLGICVLGNFMLFHIIQPRYI